MERNKPAQIRVCVVAPFPPKKIGGISRVAEAYTNYSLKEGMSICMVDTNIEPLYPRGILEKVRKFFTQPIIIFLQLLRMRKRYDVIHVYGSSSLWGAMPALVAILFSWVSSKKTVFSCHGGETEEFFRRFSPIASFIFRKTGVVTVQSSYLQGVLKKYGITSEILPNIIEIEKFTFRRRECIKNRRFLWVRHMCPAYDPFTLIRGFKSVVKKYPDATLKMIGGGELENDVRKMIESEGLSKNIIVTGEIKDMETLIREYEDADAFINTSLYDNFPMVFLEAGASGLPVITTNVGGIPHILKDNENALFIPPGNPDALAEKIIQLIENPYLVERLSTGIRFFAEENSWEDVRKRLIRVYSLEGRT